MPARQRMAAHVGGFLPPGGEHVEQRMHFALLAPDGQHGTGKFLAEIALVVGNIHRRGGAIVLQARAYRSGHQKDSQILREHRLFYRILAKAQCAKHAAQEYDRIPLAPDPRVHADTVRADGLLLEAGHESHSSDFPCIATKSRRHEEGPDPEMSSCRRICMLRCRHFAPRENLSKAHFPRSWFSSCLRVFVVKTLN